MAELNEKDMQLIKDFLYTMTPQGRKIFGIALEIIVEQQTEIQMLKNELVLCQKNQS